MIFSRSLDIFLLHYEIGSYINPLFELLPFSSPPQQMKNVVGASSCGLQVEVPCLASVGARGWGFTLLLVGVGVLGPHVVFADTEVGVASLPLAIVKVLTLY